MSTARNFSNSRRRPKPATIALIVLLHIAAIYGLARAFAPDMMQSAQDNVMDGLTVIITAPEKPPPEEPEPVPDEGAAGDPGEKTVPRAVTAPAPKIPLKQDQPVPRASSTGNANNSGAKDTGEGTGAAGSGDGTGSGRGGGGMGGIAVTKPEHISGSIDNARDYPVPEGGRQARLGTEVIVKVTVGVDGRARNCSIYRSSPDGEADRLTCQLVMDRLRFKPATDGNGDPVAAPFYWRQRWF
ncbi:TonB family protein [Pontixanthobacter sp.]|uniref:TonB family protein n=1 Tax=Pontixanthobacter sp. TaxID=2792078 RepID=UPI003C7D45CC